MDTSKLPLSPGKQAGDFVFVSGQLGLDATGQVCDPTIEGQTRQAMRSIENVLAQHDLALRDVVKINIWLTDKGDFPAFNAVYSSFFDAGGFPARSTVISELLIEGARVEIDAIALCGRS